MLEAHHPERQGARPWLRVVLRAVLFLLVLLGVTAAWLADYAWRPVPGTGQQAVVLIPRGASLTEIGRLLAQSGHLKTDRRFLPVALLGGYRGRLPAGEFSLATGQSPLAVLEGLATARPLLHPVTIPEGLRAEEIAEIFAAGGWCDPRSFTSLVVDPGFITRLGYTDLQSLEGYLYPDTYLFTRDFRGAEKIITLMVERFGVVWRQLNEDLPEPADREKTVILASIVEKEAATAAERPIIAGVFHNRLRLGMRLQADPTVVYGLEDFTGPITKAQLRTPTPYNTYLLAGLPAGPISNPGRDALAAVLQPAETESLYFVAKNDGTHHFSATLAEHNRAVQKYQRKNAPEKGKQ